MMAPSVFVAWLMLTLASHAPVDTLAEPHWSCSVSGLFRNLVTTSRSLVTPARYVDNLTRARLRVAGGRGYAFSYEVVADSETHVGNRVSLPDFAAIRSAGETTWLQLQGALVDETHVYSDLSLYRGLVVVRSASMTLTVGRQRIAWGAARFWSPADVFNPISPLQIEADVRQGVDAVQLEWAPVGSAWRSSAVYAPQKTWGRSTTAFRVGRTVAGWDVSSFGGRFGRDWLVGADASGQWGGAGVRAETTYTVRGSGSPTGNALRFTAGADYAWPSLYVVAEYFYNEAQPSCGTIAECGVQLLAPATELVTRHRHFVSAGGRYTLTPLWKVETYFVADPSGPGLFANPLLTYNASANIDLSAGAQLSVSHAGGEFRGFPPLFYAQIDIHF
jgi:hypothetical protein